MGKGHHVYDVTNPAPPPAASQSTRGPLPPLTFVGVTRGSSVLREDIVNVERRWLSPTGIRSGRQALSTTEKLIHSVRRDGLRRWHCDALHRRAGKRPTSLRWQIEKPFGRQPWADAELLRLAMHSHSGLRSLSLPIFQEMDY